MSLYYLVKLSGLASFTVKNDSFYPPTFLGKLYPVLIAGSYLLFVLTAFTLATKAFYAQDFSLFLRIWGTIWYFISIPSLLGTFVIFHFMPENVDYLMNKLCTIGNEFKSLEIDEDHGRFFRNIFKSTAIANAILVVTWILLIFMKHHTQTIIMTKYRIDSWFATNTILIFVQLLICIRKRFTRVNEALYDLLTVSGGDIRSSHHARIFVASRNNRRENQPKSEGLCTHFQRMRIIGTLHMELSDLLDRTTNLFAIPILLNSLRISVEIVLCFYWMYFTLRQSSQFKSYFLMSSVLKVVLLSVQLLVMAHASVTVCEQGNFTKAVLFKVWNKFRGAEPTDESVHFMFLKFSNQLHATVAVSAFGFMDLGYSSVYTIFGTVITYLIIVIQFDVSRVNP